MKCRNRVQPDLRTSHFQPSDFKDLTRWCQWGEVIRNTSKDGRYPDSISRFASSIAEGGANSVISVSEKDITRKEWWYHRFKWSSDFKNYDRAAYPSNFYLLGDVKRRLSGCVFDSPNELLSAWSLNSGFALSGTWESRYIEKWVLSVMWLAWSDVEACRPHSEPYLACVPLQTQEKEALITQIMQESICQKISLEWSLGSASLFQFTLPTDQPASG
jgi:hypothetical protein